MSQYRKKPVVIDAVQFQGDNAHELIDFDDSFKPNGAPSRVAVSQFSFAVSTLEGVMSGKIGDWLIRGVKGELYPCKPDIFEATYEPV